MSFAPVMNRTTFRVACSGGSKTDPKKVGVQSMQDETVKQNLIGFSAEMKKKDWKDPSGRKGKGKGVYAFADKYGTNVDGYSPIYTPDIWIEDGNNFKLGKTGLLAWLGLLVVGGAVAINLIISTS